MQILQKEIKKKQNLRKLKVAKLENCSNPLWTIEKLMELHQLTIKRKMEG